MDIGLIIGIVGLLVSVVGIPAAFYAARRSRQKPELRVCTDFDELLSPDEGVPRSALTVSYSGHAVDRVSRTIIAFWSASGDTVRGSDIVEADVLRIQVPEGDVLLQAQAISCSREPCGFEIAVDEASNSANLGFDFMDAGDGIVIEILHAGTRPARLEGTVRGATIEDRGLGTLTPRALDLVAEPSRLKRWKGIRTRQRGAPGSFSSRLLKSLWFPMAVAILAPLTLVVLYFVQLWSARLIDPAKYDLGTLDGQSTFASAVKDHGQPEISSLFIACGLIAITLLILGGLFTYVFIQVTKALIPASITTVRPGTGLEQAVKSQRTETPATKPALDDPSHVQ